MELIHSLIEMLRNPSDVVMHYGYVGLALIIFLETGAFIFFLPGDSLLFVAGLYASQGHLNIFAVNALLMVCAVSGDALSYQIGKQMGPRIFNRPDSKLLRPEHLKAAHDFYEKHGGKAIVFARFVPIVRTFVPVVAGAGNMGYRKFATFNIAGGVSWIASMTVLGYFLGQVTWIAKNLEKVVILIVLISVLPAVFEWWKSRNSAEKTA